MTEDLPKFNDVTEVISKKIASLEVLKVQQIVKLLTTINLGGVLVVLLAYMFNRTLGAGFAVILCVINGFLMAKSKAEITRLENTYKVRADKPRLF